jgi:hypothetical protein
MRYEHGVDSSSNGFIFILVRQKQWEKVRGSNKTVDVGSEALALVADSKRLLLQSLQGSAGTSVDVAWLGAAGTGRARRDSLKVAGAIPVMFRGYR